MNKRYGYNIKRVSSFEEMGLETPAQKPEIKYIISAGNAGKSTRDSDLPVWMKR